MKIAFPPRRIVVAADMSKSSLCALGVAKGLAKRYGARLDVVYAEDLPLNLLGFGPEMDAASGRELAAQMRDFLRWREARLRQQVADLPESQVQVHTLRGAPQRVVAEFARRRRADLLVLGTHGHAGLDRVVFGSVAEAAVRRAPAPVLTVHERRTPLMLSRILAPYNFQPYAQNALFYAARIARKTGARLTVLSIGAPTQWPMGPLQRLREKLETLLGKSGALRLRLTVRPGDPRREILQEAASGRHDLVVLAAHRKAYWRDTILGSTAERVLRHCPIPVLSIPSWEQERTRKGAPGWVLGKIY